MAGNCDESIVVSVGTTVRIRDFQGLEVDIAIVATAADQGLHRLSAKTPLGHALLGRQVGDEVKVETDAGTAKFTIVGINL